jgi:GntR family transcriptional regulator/MocR family aminotransferase
MDPASLVLNLDANGPRYAQIARALIALIQRGVLAPGRRAPSTRTLAEGLGCSRNVVLLAYEQLLLEGYLVSRRRAGTFVPPNLPSAPVERSPARVPDPTVGVRARLSPAGRRLVEAAAVARRVTRRQQGCDIDFMYGLAEPDDRLIGRLRRALARPLQDRSFSYGPPAGDDALRQQIARRLQAARGISRPADHVVLTSGAQQALDISARLLLGTGDRVAVEDPGYEAATAAFLAAGAAILPVRVDRDGLDPARLPDGRRAVRLVYVTPSHQFPTGAIMPVARRYALLGWARRHRAYVFEDDYDGEFRYEGHTTPALAALDVERVIYCGTFAKSLFPAVRLGYLVLPSALVEAAAHIKWVTDRGCSRLVERAVADLLQTGDYDRHVRRMQRRYRERRDALVDALKQRFGPDIEIAGASTGLHLVVWLPALATRRVDALIAGCRARGVAVYSMAPYATRALPRSGLLLGYGLVNVGDIPRGVGALFDAYQETTRPGGPRCR